MSERGILFSAPMVRAILEGTKTQTRRVVTVRRGEVPGEFSPEIEDQMRGQHIDSLAAVGIRCPFSVGQRLWVRETWRKSEGGSGEIIYAASVSDYERREKGPWRPSIFMPRSASRIDLEVTEVRVQRVQEIGEPDAVSEGIACCVDGHRWYAPGGKIRHNAPSHAFHSLWDSINGKRAPWASNPFVWCLTFRRVRP